MNVEDKTPDRHCRISAVFNQFIPTVVAQLSDVHAEGREQILRMPSRQLPLFQGRSQPLRDSFALNTAEKPGLKRIEVSEFPLGIESWIIGNVVGRADEVVEGKNRGAVLCFD